MAVKKKRVAYVIDDKQKVMKRHTQTLLYRNSQGNMKHHRMHVVFDID